MATRPAPLEGDEGKTKNLEAAQRAMLNILEDFDADRKGLEQAQSATLNLLEDFDAEKERLQEVQRATINILDDFNSEKALSEQSQRALLNILEDMDVEKSKVAEVNQQLETVNKELEAFTYSVSHDLRAPLRHVDGFSKILLEEDSAGLTEDSKRHLSRIREGTKQMGQLVDDLLNLARVGRKEVTLQVTGLGSLAQEAAEEVKRENPARQIEWKLEPLPFVECDHGLIKQVFINLLSNAAKYTRPRPQARIEIGAYQENNKSVIFVRDNGVGFSMKYADKLFGVFQRLHRTEDFEGTGIGLATVQRILHKHGGHAWAEAELDKGATFYFTLGSGEGQKGSEKVNTAGAEGKVA